MFSFKKTLFIVFISCFLSSILHSITINVPADQSTIQAGINAVVNGDIVLVQPGTYVENINYYGKLITVGSLFLTTQDTSYISQTTIDGNENFCVVIIHSGEDSTAVLIGFTITNGYIIASGGGIVCSNNSNPSLINLRITGNRAIGGGGIGINASSPSLKNVTIDNNLADFHGGGIFCSSNSSPSLENVTISNNTAVWFNGGGVYCQINSSPSLKNVTIANNTAEEFGGGICCRDNSNPILVNCILWNDTPEEIYFEYADYSNSITISYSDIQGGEAGIVTNNNGTVNWLEGNINEDPLFVYPANGDYHLTENSPCIDAGDPSSPLDSDGTITDMGAFYFDQLNAVDDNEIPISELDLSNHPNPFNPLTTISFDIKENESGILTLFNIKGQKIESQQFDSGKHNFLWDASNQASGIYLYKLQTQTIIETRKMLLLK